MQLSDPEQNTARAIFNQRMASEVDLEAVDVFAALEPLGAAGQVQVFMALFWTFGAKVGAMKQRTGIE
ncbi:hypothetical protein [Krasilnikovia sp. MM14-A1259]|uniref:hypothetical protein n=1 Tax=Krasilnikovia sp. MM14-A1259 TaxID=3373539 RepID=UPI003807782E